MCAENHGVRSCQALSVCGMKCLLVTDSWPSGRWDTFQKSVFISSICRHLCTLHAKLPNSKRTLKTTSGKKSILYPAHMTCTLVQSSGPCSSCLTWVSRVSTDSNFQKTALILARLAGGTWQCTLATQEAHAQPCSCRGQKQAEMDLGLPQLYLR